MPENHSNTGAEENQASPDYSERKRPILDIESGALVERIRSVIGNESVSSFARRSGVSEAVLRSYINDRRMPSLDKALAIANTGSVTIDWLATGHPPRKRTELCIPEETIQPMASRSPETNPAGAAEVELVMTYREASEKSREALEKVAKAIRLQTMSSWLAAGMVITEVANIFDKNKKQGSTQKKRT